MGVTKDGGPAFPLQAHKSFDQAGFALHMETTPGMSLRDYFAAMATKGIAEAYGEDDDYIELQATFAYKFADAMLAAREK